jgi:hypothetical protein
MVIEYEQSEYFLVGDTLKHIKNTTLTQVSLSYTHLTDNMLGYLCRHAEAIEVLLLEGCVNITDKGLSAVAMHCKWLRELNLAFCCMLTDIGITQLAIHLSLPASNPSSPRSSVQGPSAYHSFSEYRPAEKHSRVAPLAKLNLTACVYLSPIAVCLLAEKCSQLDVIVLDGCDRVIDWYLGSEQPESQEVEIDDNESFVSAQSHTSVSYPEWDVSRKLTVSRTDLLNRKAALDNKV